MASEANAISYYIVLYCVMLRDAVSCYPRRRAAGDLAPSNWLQVHCWGAVEEAEDKAYKKLHEFTLEIGTPKLCPPFSLFVAFLGVCQFLPGHYDGRLDA